MPPSIPHFPCLHHCRTTCAATVLSGLLIFGAGTPVGAQDASVVMPPIPLPVTMPLPDPVLPPPVDDATATEHLIAWLIEGYRQSCLRLIPEETSQLRWACARLGLLLGRLHTIPAPQDASPFPEAAGE